MPMQMTVGVESRRLLIGLLIFTAAGVVSFVIAVPSTEHMSLGAGFVVMGAFIIALHRTIARQAHRRAQFMPFAAGFWNRLGYDGAQTLCQGVGAILIAAGFFLLIRTA
jgi:hypothetical protein